MSKCEIPKIIIKKNVFFGKRKSRANREAKFV